MIDIIGRFLGQLPLWVALPVAFILVAIGWVLWTLFLDPSASDIFDRWYNRRRRARKMNNGKK